MVNTCEGVGVVESGSAKRAQGASPEAEHDLLESRFSLALVSGLSGEELARRLAVVARAGEVCHRALAFYLHDMATRGIHYELGFSTAVDFARHRLGMSKGRARDLLLTGRKLAELPLLDAAFATGEVSWSKVRRVARVATAETEAAWLARAREASHEEVDALVSVAKEGEEPRSLDRGLPATRFTKRFVLDAMQHELFEQARAKLQAELGQAVTDDEVFAEAVRLLLASSADGSVPGRRPVDGSLFRVTLPEQSAAEEGAEPGSPAARSEAARSDAAPSPRLRRQVLARDRHRCVACESQRSLMLHHIVFRSAGGPTTRDNLTTLCARCHGLVHDGFLRVEGNSDRGLRLLDRAGRPLHRRHVAPAAIRLDACATAHAREVNSGVALLRSEADIPAVVDSAWWRAHEHELAWTPTGLRVRRDGERRAS